MIKTKQIKNAIGYFQSITKAKRNGYNVKEIVTNSDKYFNKGYRYTLHINTKTKKILTEIYR